MSCLRGLNGTRRAAEAGCLYNHEMGLLQLQREQQTLVLISRIEELFPRDFLNLVHRVIHRVHPSH